MSACAKYTNTYVSSLIVCERFFSRKTPICTEYIELATVAHMHAYTCTFYKIIIQLKTEEANGKYCMCVVYFFSAIKKFK